MSDQVGPTSSRKRSLGRSRKKNGRSRSPAKDLQVARPIVNRQRILHVSILRIQHIEIEIQFIYHQSKVIHVSLRYPTEIGLHNQIQYYGTTERNEGQILPTTYAIRSADETYRAQTILPSTLRLTTRECMYL